MDGCKVDSSHDRFRLSVDAQALSDNALARLGLLEFYVAGLLTISFLVL